MYKIRIMPYTSVAQCRYFIGESNEINVHWQTKHCKGLTILYCYLIWRPKRKHSLEENNISVWQVQRSWSVSSWRSGRSRIAKQKALLLWVLIKHSQDMKWIPDLFHKHFMIVLFMILVHCAHCFYHELLWTLNRRIS